MTDNKVRIYGMMLLYGLESLEYTGTNSVFEKHINIYDFILQKYGEIMEK